MIVMIAISVRGQHNSGIILCGTFNRISAESGSSNTSTKYYFRTSWQAGLFYRFHFTNKSTLGATFLFNQIKGKARDETPATDNFGNPTGEYIVSDRWQQLSYLSIPLFFGITLHKFNVNIGLQTSFIIETKGETNTKAPDGNGGFLYFQSKSEQLPVKDFDIGPGISLSYQLLNRVSIQASYYYGLRNIHKYNGSDKKWQIQQLTFGLQYHLILPKK
jgi:hypothetical protein